LAGQRSGSGCTSAQLEDSSKKTAATAYAFMLTFLPRVAEVWHRIHVRGEVRDFWSGEPDYPLADTGKSRQHNNYFVGGGVMWRF
jgi:hypothetical protein